MNELTTDIKALHEETLNNLKNSKSLKSDLYALNVLFALELLRLFIVAS